MLDPFEFLTVARDLAGQASPGPAHRRRSVSTAYYALFHALLRRAADEFAGPDRRDAAHYTLLYRAFTHSRMKQVCEEIDKPNLRAGYREKLKRTSVSVPIRYLATAFVELQEARHQADYDPQAAMSDADAQRACGLAEFGMTMLAKADPAELRDVLSLMVFDQPRQ